jgi:hypothetical protein
MTVSAESQKAIDAYLAALRRQLGQLAEEDANDIFEEIRAHILDKTSADSSAQTVAATLAALGPPEELANCYRTDDLLKRARIGRSRGFMLRSLLRWAALSLAGLVVFAISVLGYCTGGFLVIIAVLKAIWPRGTGLWETKTDTNWGLGLGFGNQPGQGHDLLGWWLLPVGLILGSGLLILTFRFGTWSIRTFWRPRAWR